MPINLDEIAVTVFKNILDENHDNIITPNEAAQGINQHLLPSIIQSFPGIQTDSMINPASLGEFLNENGTIGDGEFKALLEQYFEFLANKTTNPAQNIIAFQNEFNNYYGQLRQQQLQQPENFDMGVHEDDFNNPAINPAAVNHVFNEQGANQRRGLAAPWTSSAWTPAAPHIEAARVAAARNAAAAAPGAAASPAATAPGATAPGIVLNYQLLPPSPIPTTVPPTPTPPAPAPAPGATASPAAPARRRPQPPSAAELYPDDHPGPRIPSRSWPNAPPGYLSRRWREENGWPVDEEDAANRAPPHSYSRRWLVEHGWPVSEETELRMARHLSDEALEGTNRHSTAALSAAALAAAQEATMRRRADYAADYHAAIARGHTPDGARAAAFASASRAAAARAAAAGRTEYGIPIDEDAELELALAVSREEQGAASPGPAPGPGPGPGPAPGATAPGSAARGATDTPLKTLDQINEIIQIRDIVLYEDVSVSEFFDNHESKKPFIIKSDNTNTFSGDAILWHSPTGATELIECKDETPSGWLGFSYKDKWIKKNARRFIRVNVSGSPTLVIKPDWYDKKIVPGTKYFNLVKQGTVSKFMTTYLSTLDAYPEGREGYNAMGAEHCSQLPPPLGVYVLQPISLGELNTIVDKMVAAEGGKRNRKSKSKNLRKIKNKYNKFTRKGIKKNKIIIKINKLNKKQKTRKGYIKNKKQTRHRKK